MDFLGELFTLLLKQPLLNALVALYQYLPGRDFGIAVIVLTLAIRFLFYPLSAKASRAQKKLSDLQPKIKELQEKHKNNREQQAKAMWELYRQEKINPFSSILPILVQLPVLIALYHLFWAGFGQEQLELLYSFISHPATINTIFLGLVDLASKNYVIALLAGVTQFLQLKQTMGVKNGDAKKDAKKGQQPDFATMFRKQSLFIFPVMIVIIASQLPSAVGLYLITTSVFSIWQYWFVTREKRTNKQPLVTTES